ncbi:MAG: M15 family metallopeptidase [Treponema sp.]|nr:M15 family metallopeptidase [Treponema sp.]
MFCKLWLVCAALAVPQTGNGAPVQRTAGETAAAQAVPDRAELVMKALAAAYPGRVGAAEFRKITPAETGDWAVQIDGVWFYYAQGRLLPEQIRSRYAEYDPQPFYNYAAELPPWKDPTPEENQRFRDSAGRRAANPPKRSQHFFDALWRASTWEESYDRVKTMRFLGRNVMVHYSIMEELALVEERILETAKTNAQVRQWINRIGAMAGWNWRTIADTQSRSFHAYGTAVDLLPGSHGGLQTYWLWTAENFPAWWAVPYERRSHPPEAVIRAFEEYGFIWGGKWLFFDTMHFEYRPEILLLSNIAFKIAA